MSKPLSERPAGYGEMLKGLYGDKITIQKVQEELTIAAAASTTAAIAFPAKSLGLGVTWRVKETIPGITNIDVGVTGAATRFATDDTNKDDGETGAGASCDYYGSATTLLITPNTSPSAATGVLILTAYYIQLTPPTRDDKK